MGATQQTSENSLIEASALSTSPVALLQGILNASPGCVAYYEPVRSSDNEPGQVIDFVYRVVNTRLCSLIGRPVDQLVGQQMTELSPTVKTNGLFARYVRVLETGEADSFESTYLADGTEGWYMITAEPLASGLVVSLIDITDRKQAELHARRQADELRATLDASLNSILLMRAMRDAAGQIIDFRMETANKSVVNSLFRQPEELVGQTLLSVFPGNVESGFFALYARVADTGYSEQAEYYYQDKNGFRGWFEVSAVRQETDLIVLTFNNVTAQREARLAQEGQTQVLQAILDHSQTAISLHEPVRNEQGQIVDFRPVLANRQALLSLAPLTDVIPQQSVANIQQTDEFARYVRVIETGQPDSFEVAYNNRYYAITIAGADGGVVTSAVDVTNDRQYRFELEAVNRTLQQSNESLQSFAYVASHDLQEPLRRIQAFSDILQNQFEDNLSEGERDMARRIQKSANRMQLLIKDLLAYSQVAAHRDPYAAVDLNDVFDDVVSDLDVSIAEKKATVQVNPLPTVQGSASRLRQLMQNLVSNALKFRRPSVAPFVQIDARPAQPGELPESLPDNVPFWLISITDNGIGFDEKYKDRIFQPFQRLHNVATYSGTGIGLAICQRVAESHGGAIDVSSRPNEGTTFRLFLPVS
ncbi:ATP-binding protein [Spirosoma sp. 209]|uniref:PAS domain-containing sensor histidine kinase n=1 Tax=Spirosoma sp. 209 TaxID=1955701 RepID=UPI00098D6591|nr:ATP-binding protein [Spirosoma sp. 209]